VPPTDRSPARRVRDALDRRGPRQSRERVAAEASDYWTAERDLHWRSNSHFRDAPAFADGGASWSGLGRDHVALVAGAARAAGWRTRAPVVVDWGCGGGAVAAALAPTAGEMVLVDLSDETLAEATERVRESCDTPVRAVRTTVDATAPAVAEVGACDLFVCFHVLELVPTEAHGLAVLDAAAALLRPGGLAVVQFRYDDGAPASRSRRRGYRRDLANMTTYTVPAFWGHAAAAGLEPRAVTLVPRSDLDERYAYLSATAPDEGAGGPPSSRS